MPSVRRTAALPAALNTGTAITAASTAPAVSDIRYRPISSPASSGLRRLTRLGSSTLTSEIAPGGQDRAREQQHAGRGRAQPEPDREQCQGQDDDPLLADPPGQYRSQAGEDARS